MRAQYHENLQISKDIPRASSSDQEWPYTWEGRYISLIFKFKPLLVPYTKEKAIFCAISFNKVAVSNYIRNFFATPWKHSVTTILIDNNSTCYNIRNMGYQR